MNFLFYMPTKIIAGKECVRENGAEFKKLGSKALIVTGKKSARESGALDDVIAVLNENNIAYEIFDEVENNPSLENMDYASKRAREFKPDYVIGIGGGSPLDAAKAIAVLAVNKFDSMELFSGNFKNKPLPIICIPTTAGTGSEVTQYSILTVKGMETKKSFASADVFPRIAFLDAKYTESLSVDITVNTAIDALSHAIEGYICKKSTALSDILAIEAMKLLGECLLALREGEFTYQTREKLLYASTISGIVIAQTGTTIVHGLGYSLTYFWDYPHGKANGILLPEYLRFNYHATCEKINKVLSLLKFKDIDEFEVYIKGIFSERKIITQDEAKKFAYLASKQGTTSNNIREAKIEDLELLLIKILG